MQIPKERSDNFHKTRLVAKGCWPGLYHKDTFAPANFYLIRTFMLLEVLYSTLMISLVGFKVISQIFINFKTINCKP